MSDKSELVRSLSDESADSEPKHPPLHVRNSWPSHDPVSPRGPMKGKCFSHNRAMQQDSIRCMVQTHRNVMLVQKNVCYTEEISQTATKPLTDSNIVGLSLPISVNLEQFQAFVPSVKSNFQGIAFNKSKVPSARTDDTPC